MGYGAAVASEGQVAGGPIGGTDIRNAYLPPLPGLYIGLVGSYVSVNRSYDANGNWNHNVHAQVSFTTPAIGLTYVYPFKLYGGTLASSIQAFYLDGPIKINGHQQDEHDFGDLYTDILAWSRHWQIGAPYRNPAAPKLPYGLTTKFAYSMVLPAGEYNKSQILPAGHNVFYFIPNAALTYLTRPNWLGDGLEISAHAFFDIAAENTATHYHSGTVSDLDFAISEREGPFQVGMAGYAAQQFDRDIEDGVPVGPEGKRLEQIYLGPIATYDAASLGGTFKLKVQLPVVIKNGLNATRIYLIYSMKL